MISIPFQIAYALVATLATGDYLADAATFGDKDLISLSKERLDPERQTKFAALYESLSRETQAYENAVQRVCDADPLYSQALQSEVEASHAYMDAKMRLDAYEVELAKKYPKAVPDYEIWRESYRRLYEENGRAIADAADDPNMRPYVEWFCQLMLARPVDEQPKSIQPFLPQNTANLTAEEAVELVLKICRKRKHDDLRSQVESTEKKLSYLKLPRALVEQKTLTNMHDSGLHEYISMNKPDDVKQAEKRAGQIGNDMVTVWPEWRHVNEQLLEEKGRRKQVEEQRKQRQRNAPLIPAT
jgi:hypothetical protein